MCSITKVYPALFVQKLLRIMTMWLSALNVVSPITAIAGRALADVMKKTNMEPSNSGVEHASIARLLPPLRNPQRVLVRIATRKTPNTPNFAIVAGVRLKRKIGTAPQRSNIVLTSANTPRTVSRRKAIPPPNASANPTQRIWQRLSAPIRSTTWSASAVSNTADPVVGTGPLFYWGRCGCFIVSSMDSAPCFCCCS